MCVPARVLMIGLFLGAVDYIFNLVVTRTLVG